MKLDRVALFRNIRPIFGGSLNQGQVNGVNALLNAADTEGLSDPRQIAYVLATAKWETAHTMQPIAEYGKGKGRSYGKPDPGTGKTYYGRGFVQLTWKANYERAGKELGLPLVMQPDRAMEPETAARIAISGMLEGWFTGKKLSDYFNAKVTDWKGARRIINGTDKAAEIAAIAKQFHAAILASIEPEANADPAAVIPAPPPPAAPAKSATNWIAATGTAVPAVATAAKAGADYVNSTVTQVKDTAGQVTETVTTIRDGAGTVSGLIGYALSPPVLIALAIVALAAVIFFVLAHSKLMRESAS